MSTEILLEQSFYTEGKKKTFRVCCGNLVQTQESYDLLVVSAAKGGYHVRTSRSLVGALRYQKGINMEELAARPALDLRQVGGWLSGELDSNFRRLAVVEILDPAMAEIDPDYYKCREDLILKKTCSTMKFLMEQADCMGAPLRSAAMPVLGSGRQGIEIGYIAVPLITQCHAAMQTIPDLESITFYEMDPEKAEYIAGALVKFFQEKEKHEEKVFISYSSAQSRAAHEICDFLARNEIPCWMAPESIAPGSDYMMDIPDALMRIQVVLLLLSREAQLSRWVGKEISTAIGADKIVIPWQIEPCELDRRFRFLLEGEQIYPAWEDGWERHRQALLTEMRRNLGLESSVAGEKGADREND